jgi:hypothetical protein
MLKLSQKCYEERYQNPLGGKEQEKIISAILKCYSDIFYVAKEYSLMYFWEVADFTMKII